MALKGKMRSGVKVETHKTLSHVSESHFRSSAVDVMRCADQGVQTLVVTAHGVRTIVGLNGCRFLPDPPDIPELAECSIAIAKTEEQEK